MRKSSIFVFTVTMGALAWFDVPRAGAQEIYKAFVSEVCITTNSSGNLVYKPFGNFDFIRQCAQDNGITNLMGLSLVYNRTANALQVVRGTNHDLVCTPLSFSGGTSLSNSNGTKVETLEFVFVDSNTTAAGTFAATERSFLNSSNQLSAFSLNGRLQYTASAGTNGPALYRGTVFAGQGFFFPERWGF